MPEPNVIINQQSTNVVVTRESPTPVATDAQIVVADTSKPSNLNITTIDPNNTASIQSLNISSNNNIQLVNASAVNPNQPIDTQNIIVYHDKDVSVVAADRGGPPGPPPTVESDPLDPSKIYIGGVEFVLPTGPVGPPGPSGSVGPQGPPGDLDSIIFGTGTTPLLTYNDSNDILKIVGSGSTSVSYDDTNKQITISSASEDSSKAAALVTTVFNKTASTIPKFSVVYINGGQGDLPTIGLALASGEMTSSKTYGVTYENIPQMSSGRLIVYGALTGLNTDQFNPTAPQGNINGTTLWLSPTVPGGLTTTKPLAPNHMVSVGTVIRTHQNEGVVEVKIQNGFELEELHNVATTGATNGQFLQYNSGSGLWLPSSSGNFSTLQVNGTGVSINGHTHTSSEITNFNSSVSGLLPSNIVTGVGTSGYLSRWTGSNSIDSAVLFDNGTNIGIGTTSPSTLLDVSGTILANRFTTTSANNINIGSGQIYLNGDTGNRIDFNGSGIGAPAFTTNRSPGTKIVLAPNTSSTQTEYALGIEAGAMWFSIPVAASRAFQWYAGTANIATLFGNGTLDIKGNTSRINVDSLRLDDNMLSTTTANSNLILYPNGNGSLVADPSGNLRGIYSNDFQRERTSVSGVAAGGYSVICGGSDNRTANSYSIVCGGQTNTASNAWSIVCGGDLNTASGNRSVVVGGGSNTSSSQSSTVGGGSNNQSTGTYSTVPGGFRGKATRHGELSHSAGMFNNTGDAQHTTLIARRLTTDATADVVLTLNGLAPTSTNIFNIPAQTTWTFSIKLSAYNLTNNEGAWWIFRGGIKRNNANSTVLVGSLISESGSETSLSTATARVVADDTNEALEIRVTGVSGKNIRWVAVTDISQVSYGTP